MSGAAIEFVLKVKDAGVQGGKRTERKVTIVARSKQEATEAYYAMPGHWDSEFLYIADATIVDHTYTYRSNSCVGATHAVCGIDTLGGAGVLEWCSDAEDAEDRIAEMRRYKQFKNLNIDNSPFN